MRAIAVIFAIAAVATAAPSVTYAGAYTAWRPGGWLYADLSYSGGAGCTTNDATNFGCSKAPPQTIGLSLGKNLNCSVALKQPGSAPPPTTAVALLAGYAGKGACAAAASVSTGSAQPTLPLVGTQCGAASWPKGNTSWMVQGVATSGSVHFDAFETAAPGSLCAEPWLSGGNGFNIYGGRMCNTLHHMVVHGDGRDGPKCTVRIMNPHNEGFVVAMLGGAQGTAMPCVSVDVASGSGAVSYAVTGGCGRCV